MNECKIESEVLDEIEINNSERLERKQKRLMRLRTKLALIETFFRRNKYFKENYEFPEEDRRFDFPLVFVSSSDKMLVQIEPSKLCITSSRSFDVLSTTNCI